MIKNNLFGPSFVLVHHTDDCYPATGLLDQKPTSDVVTENRKNPGVGLYDNVASSEKSIPTGDEPVEHLPSPEVVIISRIE